MDAFPNTQLTNWCNSAIGATATTDKENAAISISEAFMYNNTPYGVGAISNSSATPYWGRVTITLPGTYYVSRFECWNACSAVGGLIYKLEYYNGAWVAFDTWTPVSTNFNDPDQNNFTTGYANVSKIRFTADNVTNTAYAYVNLLAVYGGRDCGIRFDQAGTTWLLLGNYPLQLGDKVRLYDGTYTCGLDLLAIDDICASPIHVYTGAAVKALAGTVAP